MAPSTRRSKGSTAVTSKQPAEAKPVSVAPSPLVTDTAQQTPQVEDVTMSNSAGVDGMPDEPKVLLPSETSTGTQDTLIGDEAIRQELRSQLSIDDESSLELLGAGARVLIHAIKELSTYGIDTTIPLPKIVVIGDQSAGKSSLIEGISEIQIPRNSGTCTRCPLQINLSATGDTSAGWQCTVTLVKTYDLYAKGQLSERDDDGNKRPFWPWSERDSPAKFTFATVRDKSVLEAVIWSAQTAILNPGMDPRIFQGQNAVEITPQVDFSPNLICLDIVGPNLTALTIYDLPGIIAQTQEDDGSHVVKLVKNLMKHYIHQENTLILAALPMDQEAETSSSHAILRKAKVNSRCIGVITKPDRATLDGVRVDLWKDILHGKNFKFEQHGYYVTKQPSQAELKNGITHHDAREREAQFFGSPAWISRFGDIPASRLGTKNLQQALASKLAVLIHNCLPNFSIQVREKQLEIQQDLLELPDPPANAVEVVNSIVSDFALRFKKCVEDDPSCREFLLKARDINAFFIEAINSARPTVVVKSSEPLTPAKRSREIINLETDSDSDTPCPQPKPRTPRSNKRVKTLDGTPTPSYSSTPLPTRLRNAALKPGQVPRKIFRLSDLCDELNSYNTSGLPGTIDRRAIDNIALSTLELWNDPLDHLVTQIQTALEDVLHQTLEQAASAYSTTELYQTLRTIGTTFITTHVYNLRTITNRLLSMERYKPLTENRDELDRLKLLDLAVLQEARHKSRVRSYLEEAENFKDMDEGKRETRLEKACADEKIKTRLGPDPYERELDALSRVRAYYDIASSRFTDNVAQAVKNDMFPTMHREIEQSLRDGLQEHRVRTSAPTSAADVGADSLDPVFDAKPNLQSINGIVAAGGGGDLRSYCARLLEEQPERARLRESLKDKLRRLGMAHERLEQVKKDFYGSNGV